MVNGAGGDGWKSSAGKRGKPLQSPHSRSDQEAKEGILGLGSPSRSEKFLDIAGRSVQMAQIVPCSPFTPALAWRSWKIECRERASSGYPDTRAGRWMMLLVMLAMVSVGGDADAD